MAGVVAVYLTGVIVGLWRTDARLRHRAVLALLWPLAPVACALTLTVLGLAAVVLFPAVGLTAALAAAGLWWLL